MKAITFTITISILLAFGERLYAQDTITENNSRVVTFDLSYTGDDVGNLMGGIKKGAAYLGLVDFGLAVNTGNAGLWKGGELYIQIQNTHGNSPTASLVGDNQVFSNIENGNYTYLYELRYKHTIERFWVNFGIIDLNSEFIVTEEGSNFINSSFGVIPTVSGNVPLSIFPKNSLGVMVNYAFDNGLSVQAALMDGDPGDLENDPFNLKHNISREQGLFSVGEIIYSSQKGKYKFGGYYHSGRFADVLSPSSIKKYNYGFYALLDQTLAEFSANKELRSFIQLGYAPTNRNYLDWYYAGGVNLYSPFSRNGDVVGLAIARASINNNYFSANSAASYRCETAVEFSYSVTLSNYISIKPNVQYIINPGICKSKTNALVSTLRFNFSL